MSIHAVPETATTGHLRVQRLYGTGPEKRFERVTKMAATFFGVPYASINLLGDDAFWVKSRVGFDASEVPVAGSLSERTIHANEPLVLEDIPAGEHRMPDGRAVRFHASYPLRADGQRPVGTFSLWDVRPRVFTPLEREQLEIVAAWVDEEIMHETQAERAAEVQKALIPHTDPIIAGFEVAGACMPSRWVGGDFIDWSPGDDGLTVTLGDVMGKGMAAAILAATARGVMRSADESLWAAQAVDRAAALLSEDLEAAGAFITLFHARLTEETGKVYYVDAGHGLALLVRRDGSVSRLAHADPPLGIFPGYAWTTNKVTLQPGDSLVCFSDGVLDLYDGTLDGLHEVAELLHRSPSVTEFVESITAMARSANDIDDIAVLAIRRTASG